MEYVIIHRSFHSFCSFVHGYGSDLCITSITHNHLKHLKWKTIQGNTLPLLKQKHNTVMEIL